MSVRNLYWLTAALGCAGCLAFGWRQGTGTAIGFALGAAGSLLNLWAWEWLGRSIEPGDERRRNPWQAGVFIGRYIVLIAGGYAMVKALGVPALAVVTGLLTSTAAVLAALIVEIVQGFLGKRFTG